MNRLSLRYPLFCPSSYVYKTTIIHQFWKKLLCPIKQKQHNKKGKKGKNKKYSIQEGPWSRDPVRLVQGDVNSVRHVQPAHGCTVLLKIILSVSIKRSCSTNKSLFQTKSLYNLIDIFFQLMKVQLAVTCIHL